MYTQEEVQFQLIQQTAFGVVPGSPSGILIPSEAGFSIKHSRSKLENPQVQADGFKRKFALGNHVTTADGNHVPNLNYLGHLLRALCSSLSSAAFTGIYQINVTAGGSGYTSAPTVGFTSGDGTGAAAVAVIEGGSVTSIIITNRGTGYTVAPTIGFTGGAGTGAAATAVLDGAKYKHVGVLSSGAPAYYILEKGVKGSTLWRSYMNMVLMKLGLTLPVEGICSVSESWVGSGHMTTGTASLDATPTEITGEPGEYANIAMVEGGVATSVISDLSINVDLTVKDKRTHNHAGKATQLRKGASAVTGEIKSFYEDETLAAKADAKTLTSLLACLTSADGKFESWLPEVQLEPGEWERSDAGIMIPFTYESVYDASSAAPVTFTLINGTVSYP